MSLAEGTGANSSPESTALGEVLTFFGTVADFAAGAPPQSGELVASVATAMARQDGLPQQDCDALYFAALLRNAGALGNPAFPKGQPLPDRALSIARWDVPPDGARICERIAALPEATADIVRWQSESWDGTGFPDRLRWSGIPKTAQLLKIASAYVAIADPEEALTAITAESGRSYSPEQTRTFVMWFHTSGGEIRNASIPSSALAAERSDALSVLTLLGERIDAHNGTPHRASRIAALVRDVAEALDMPSAQTHQAVLAALLFAAGELRSMDLEASQFDALARLGMDVRVRHAVAASQLIAACPFLQNVAPIVRARAEWYDGTGAPEKLRHEAIPQGARVLAAAIAYDGLDQNYRTRITEERISPLARMDMAAGTQFDPRIVRALADVVKAHA